MPRRVHGFTLIEAVITMGIVAIVGSLAYATYQSQALSSRRSDAKIALTAAAQRLESCRARTFLYAGCEAFPQPSDQGFYQITASPAPTATAFFLTATPVAHGPQVHDTKCTTLTLDNRGQQGATGTHTDQCW